MTYKQNVQIPASAHEVPHYVASCIKCDCDDLKVEEYEDQYGAICTISCKKCSNKVKVNDGIEAVIKKWNEENDFDQLLVSKVILIEKTRGEIKDLKALRLKRKKK